jgi:hypothetical protein
MRRPILSLYERHLVEPIFLVLVVVLVLGSGVATELRCVLV